MLSESQRAGSKMIFRNEYPTTPSRKQHDPNPDAVEREKIEMKKLADDMRQEFLRRTSLGKTKGFLTRAARVKIMERRLHFSNRFRVGIVKRHCRPWLSIATGDPTGSTWGGWRALYMSLGRQEYRAGKLNGAACS